MAKVWFEATLYYSLILDDGEEINLYDTPYSQVEITQNIGRVHDVIRYQGISYEINDSEYESIKEYYSGEELDIIEKVFEKKN